MEEEFSVLTKRKHHNAIYRRNVVTHFLMFVFYIFEQI